MNLTRSDASYYRGSVQRRRRGYQRSVAYDSNCDFPRKDYACCCDCCDDDGGVVAVAVVAVVAVVAAVIAAVAEVVAVVVAVAA